MTPEQQKARFGVPAPAGLENDPLAAELYAVAALALLIELAAGGDV